MRKSEKNKEQLKIKELGNLKFMRYATYSCVALVLLFLMYIAIMAQSVSMSYEQLISSNPIFLIGFLICTVNLYVWFLLKRHMKDLKEVKNIDSIRIQLIIMAIFQLLTLNIAAASLLFLSLYSYFKWDKTTLPLSWKYVHHSKQAIWLYGSLAFFILMDLSVYSLYFAIN